MVPLLGCVRALGAEAGARLEMIAINAEDPDERISAEELA